MLITGVSDEEIGMAITTGRDGEGAGGIRGEIVDGELGGRCWVRLVRRAIVLSFMAGEEWQGRNGRGGDWREGGICLERIGKVRTIWRMP